MFDVFKEQALALEDGGVDAICIETMSALDEALCAVKAVKMATKFNFFQKKTALKRLF